MANSIYPVNKGINKSIEFKGLRAQYIWYLGGGLLALLILFAVMYIMGISSIICIAIVLIAGAILFIKVYAMSNKYGEHGMMKAAARRSVPKVIKLNSRKIFTGIKK
jgi:predicted lysophospholipase L1 biosynthesis ABC-type transport system permease subunit